MNFANRLLPPVAAIIAIVVFPVAGIAASAKAELAEAMRSHADHARGERLFARCVRCHGADGNGEVNGSVPRIAGQHYRVLLKQLVDFRHGQRPDFRMEEPAKEHQLGGPRELADVALFLASQDRGGARGIGRGDEVEKGERLYRERCLSCHGQNAAGDDAQMIPRLGGQHYSYLVRQMYDAVDQRRPAMVRTHAKRIEPLEFAEVRALADYLSRLGPGLGSDSQ